MLDLSTLPESVIVAVVVTFALLVLLVPIALRIAGLTGQQVSDTISLTLQFFVNIVREFRAQNQDSTKP